MAKIARPFTIQSAQLSSSSVSATSSWSSTGIYAADDVVKDTSDPPREYTALKGYTQSAAVTCNSTTDGITWTSHGLSAGDEVVFSGLANLTDGQVYYFKTDLGGGSFTVSETDGGSTFNITSNDSGTGYAAPGDTLNANKALTNATYWIESGPTNRWAMFDGYSTKKTEDTSDIVVTIDLGTERADGIQLLGMENITQVRVVANDGSDFYDETYSLIETAFSDEWYAVAGHYTETRYKTALRVDDIPPKSGTDITITCTVTGTGKVGLCSIGLSNDMSPGAQYGASLGIRNYSDIIRSIFGTVTVIERAYSNKGSFEVWVPIGKADAFFDILASFRAMPLMWSMIPDGSTSGWAARGEFFGIYVDFEELIRYPTTVVYSLELEGLGNG